MRESNGALKRTFEMVDDETEIVVLQDDRFVYDITGITYEMGNNRLVIKTKSTVKRKA